jgi:hypothetical protein
MTEDPTRDHLFISYASEDGDLAEWLTLKLTSEGYAVWCDRFKLLGGESYPKNIDDAIKNHTFRVLSLLSRHSLSKPNPLKERTLALNIARSRNEDFLIPLNVDALRPTELDWMTSDLTFIPFYKSWATGLKKLLKKLSSINAPRPLRNGKEIAAGVYLNTGFIGDEPETVSTNCLRVLKVPKKIKKFRIGAYTTRFALLELAKNWPIYPKDRDTVFAFHSPSEEDTYDFEISSEEEYDWRKSDNIEGIDVANIVSNLISRSTRAELFGKGLIAERSKLYFPPGLLEGDRIRFRGYSGRNTFVKVVGRRILRRGGQEPEEFLYSLSPDFRVRRDLEYGYTVQLTLHVHVTDMLGQPLSPRSASARSKRIRRSWWNHEWYNRYLAVIGFLAEGEDTIVLGDNADEQIEISAKFLKDEAPISVIEEGILEEEVFDGEEIEIVDNEYDDEERDDGVVIRLENDKSYE